jgi:hypothetical protein
MDTTSTTRNGKLTKSELMSAYNFARSYARRNPEKLDPRRVDRAFGILQSKEARPYTTTTRSCNCPDATKARKNGYTGPCKHRTAQMLLVKIEKLRAEHNVTELVKVNQQLEA